MVNNGSKAVSKCVKKICACVHVCIYAHRYMHMHAYIHIYIYTHECVMNIYNTYIHTIGTRFTFAPTSSSHSPLPELGSHSPLPHTETLEITTLSCQINQTTVNASSELESYQQAPNKNSGHIRPYPRLIGNYNTFVSNQPAPPLNDYIQLGSYQPARPLNDHIQVGSYQPAPLEQLIT